MKLLLAQPILEKTVPKSHKSARLAIILVGNDPASELYVAIKQKRAAIYGVNVQLTRLPETLDEPTLKKLILSLNADTAIDGVIIQLPLPTHITTDNMLNLISPKKSVTQKPKKSH